MAQIAGTAENLIDSTRREATRLRLALVGIAGLALISLAVALTSARPAPVMTVDPAAAPQVVDGWMLSAARGVGTAGSDVRDGWMLAAPRGVGTSGADLRDGWMYAIPRGVSAERP